MKRSIIIFCVSLIFFIACAPADMLWGSPYYEKKVIYIIVGGNPGGGYDRTARLMGKYLSKYIPGHPSIVIQNMAGGGGGGSMIAANYLYNVAKPDGMTVGTLNRYLALEQLVKSEGVKFDMAKYSWIGSAATEASVFTVRSDLPYKSIDDFLKAKTQIYVAVSGGLTTATQFTPILMDFLGDRVKYVTYISSAEIMLALERKEVDCYGFTYSTAKLLIGRGILRPLMRGNVIEPGMENLPANVDITADPKTKNIINMLSSIDQMGRPFIAPRGVPEPVLKILREAFAQVIKDPALKEDCKKLNIALEYTKTEDCLKIVNNILNQPNETVEKLNKYVNFIK